MSLLYKIIQDKRVDSSNLWYGRAVHLETIDMDGLADIMQRNCTVKKSDIKAVLTELVEVMTDQLQNSMIVKLDGFGSFRIGLKTKGAETEEDFSVLKNVVGTRVNFLPEGHRSAGSAKVTRTFLNGCSLQRME